MVPLVLLAAVAVGAIIALLSLLTVKKWFRKSSQISNKTEVNIVLKQKLKNGSYKTVGGVFNTQTEQIVTATAWESKKLDEDLAKLDRVSILRNLD